MIYKTRTNWWEHWTVYTNKDTVSFMLDQIDYKAENDLSSISILDPCSWDWVFLITCLGRLLKSSQKYNFSFTNAFIKNFYAVEIDECKLQELQNNIEKFLKKEKIIIDNFDAILGSGDFLMKNIERKFDIVIGNPPYIRYDNIPDEMREKYKTHFQTFKWRCDMYVPFYEKGLQLLKKDWKLCYICSNRWLKSGYWATLRKLISHSYDFLKIINLEHIQVFDEDVIAYPAITIIQNSSSNWKTKYYDIFNKKILTTHWLESTNDESFSFSLLDNLSGKNWNFWQAKHTTFKSIEEQGFKIWIWLATWADKVFISKTLSKEVENEILIPLITSRDLRGNDLSWSWNHLINPFSESWDLINLEQYPKLHNYLTKHRDILVNRHISKRNPDKWYRTIDKIKISLLKETKLILPDTSSNEIVLMDHWNYYPHHNLVYITHQDERLLKILWALLSSDFWKNQMRKVWNLMNWGFIRWQIQNLRKIDLPDINELNDMERQGIIESYDKQSINSINSSILTLLTSIWVSV